MRWKWFKPLDEILCGEATRLPALREGRITIPAGGIAAVTVLLGVIYGICMSSFALIRTGGGAYMQTVASATKLPLLFFLTLGITLPSLYVFNSLMGSRLSMGSVLRLLRPFIGNPDTPTHFFRQGAWGNAYVKLGEILWRLIGG